MKSEFDTDKEDSYWKELVDQSSKDWSWGKMIEKGTEAWRDMPDTWVDDIRGNDE